jgi:hypothetical protein
MTPSNNVFAESGTKIRITNLVFAITILIRSHFLPDCITQAGLLEGIMPGSYYLYICIISLGL